MIVSILIIYLSFAHDNDAFVGMELVDNGNLYVSVLTTSVF